MKATADCRTSLVLVKIALVTPCFNEEKTVRRCHEEVRRVMSSITPPVEWEHIFSDNSSSDGTLKLLKEIASRDPSVRVLSQKRNVGPFRNIASALRHVSSDVDLVVPMVPADLQDPPEAIPEMIAIMSRSKVEIVYGIRTNRQESLSLRIARSFYYQVLRLARAATPPPHAGEFMLVSRNVLKVVNEANDEYPYIRGLVARTGLPNETIKYEWRVRQEGESRNSWMDLLDQGLNGLIKSSRTAARLSLLVGIGVSIVGFVVAFATVIGRLTNSLETMQGVPAILTAILVLGGTQMIFLGIVGEYVIDVHATLRAQRRIDEVVELTPEPPA
jgi:glycosyltransferase involved in cell wall biosynthesis